MGQEVTLFNARQHMLRCDYEAFNYCDDNLSSVAPHRHNFYELLFFQEGDVTYTIDETAHVLLPGDLLIIPVGLEHFPNFGGTGRYRRIVLWLTADFIRSLEEGEELLRCFEQCAGSGGVRLCRFEPEDAARILECAAAIAEESSYERPFSITMSVLLITRLLIMIHRLMPTATERSEGSSTSQKLVNDAVEYINEHLDKELTLDILAERFFISKFYLSRVFKKHMGVTPHSYISQRRLSQAKQLLYNGAAPTEVYKRCGYSDYSSFFRAFKERYGFSPKQLREE